MFDDAFQNKSINIHGHIYNLREGNHSSEYVLLLLVCVLLAHKDAAKTFYRGPIYKFKVYDGDCSNLKWQHINRYFASNAW